MKWTTNRPTEPGDYWLAIHPDQRGALYDEGVYKVVLRHGEGKVWQAGCLATIPEERLAGAQWAPRETPADPFAQSAGTWSPRIAVLEKIAGALGYRIEIMPGLDVAGRCHYHRRLIEIGEPDARYAFSVIAHELGHALHGCLVEDVETARTKEQREACATAFASAIGMMAGCEHGRGTDCNLAHALTAESMGAVLAKIAPSLPPWRAELERLRGLIIKPASTSPEEYQRLTQRLVALEELDALRSLKEGAQPIAIPEWVLQVEPGFAHFTPGTFRLMDGAWRERIGVLTQTIQPEELGELIDAAGAAVLAGEG